MYVGQPDYGLSYSQVHSTDNRSMELRVFLQQLLDHACSGYNDCAACGDLRRVLASIESLLMAEVLFPEQAIARHAGG